MAKVKDPVRGGVQSERFWTFLPSSFNVSANAAQHPVVKVTGYFAFIVRTVRGLEEGLDVFPTQPDEIITLSIPPWMFAGMPVDQISAKMVQLKLEELFRLPFKKIPKAPFDVPIYKIAPSKRDKAIAALMKARLKELSAMSPEEASE